MGLHQRATRRRLVQSAAATAGLLALGNRPSVSERVRAMQESFDWQRHKGAEVHLILNKHPYTESLLPLKVSESNARDLIRRWYGRQWIAPNALGKRALTDTVKAIYLPFWTFDAQAHARWTAESGTYYYTGSGKSRQRHVSWRPAAGELSHVFDDELSARRPAFTAAASGRSSRSRPKN